MWNYRVIKNGNLFEIGEVHYDKKNRPYLWGEVMPAESVEDLKEGYEYLLSTAFEMPVLTVVDGKLIETSSSSQ